LTDANNGHGLGDLERAFLRVEGEGGCEDSSHAMRGGAIPSRAITEDERGALEDSTVFTPKTENCSVSFSLCAAERNCIH